MENTLLTGLSFTAFGLLILVTVGIIYLTLAEWRDRRRLMKEQKKNRRG